MALAASDIVEITQLYATYSLSVDEGDVPTFVNCFTDDGVMVADTVDPIVGRDALAELCKGVPVRMLGTRHMPCNVEATGDGDEATGRCYLLIVIAGADPKIVGSGIYHDELRRVGGAWRFVRREFVRDR